MKKFLLGAAAAVAIAAPGAALAQTTGEVGVHYNNIDLQNGPDMDVWGLNAAVAHDFGGFTVQGDASSSRYDASSDIGIGNVSIAAGVRNDAYAVYGFVGHSSFGSDSANIGFGGQYHLDRLSFNGSVGVADFDGIDVRAANIDGTYYFTDNFGVLAEVGYGEARGGGETEWTSAGVGGIYRFNQSPLTFDFGYRRTEHDVRDSDLLRVGATIAFGTTSARDAARNGPSFNGGRRLAEQTINVF
ncbi:MAG: hypothetical protein NVV62_07195 [Terricaulis sp.]|nr:hypothetical protein [Terricaulis sp.]